jgi:hypothetical protein
MLDLAILLSISLAVTALLGLLLIGFVWVPWLIGLVLLVLLIALMKLTSSSEPQPVVSLDQAGDSVAQQGQDSLDDKGAESSPDDAVMVYRGVKYKRASEDKTASTPSAATQGKYRGQQWSR